jgi:predicted CXXCH cytochrome family protein
MHDISFLKFGLRMMRRFSCAKSIAVWVASALILFVLLMGLFGIGAPLSAQQKSPAPAVPTVKPHDPLKGKDCTDCHKRVVSSKINCLLAKEDLCESCHKVPAEGGFSRLVDTPEPLCFKCHKKDQFKGSVIHGPFAAGACITCHNPHGGSVPGMLRSTGPQMCLECHKEMSARFSNARFPHKAALTGCTNCHSPHLSDQQHLLTAAVPKLCGKCHADIAKDVRTAVVKHSPVTKDSSCMNCHDPHEAQESGLLLEDGLDNCLKCHDKTVKDEARNLEFKDMKKLLAANPYAHGPIQNRDCSACHNPHGASYSGLLTNQYPQGFYAPFFTSNYDLCFRCHDATLATQERTTSTTEFRDGDRNLHFIHVNKTSHGRTCRSCHVVHASTNPKQIAATVPFGNWELPVKYEKTDNGGSCTPGCHTLQKYSRQTAKLEKR